MAITTTGTNNVEINGKIGSANTLDGVSVTAGADIGIVAPTKIVDFGGGAGINISDSQPLNNISRLVITNGVTVTINGNINLTEGSEVVLQPYSTLNIGGVSFTAGNETITYIHSTVSISSTNNSCRIDDLFYDHNDDDHDPSGVGMMVMGDENLPLVDVTCC